MIFSLRKRRGNFKSDAVGIAALILVVLAWIGFGLVFLLRKKPATTGETKRAPAARWGIALQGLSFALVWLAPRSPWWPFRPSLAVEVGVAGVAVVLAYGSCWLCLRAVEALGKQWTYQARVIQGHELITHGPYAVVRNPIYLGMFGMLIATGLAFSAWWNFLASAILFLAGNRIRIDAEEQLLRQTFGSQFDDYQRRVPAFVPRLF